MREDLEEDEECTSHRVKQRATYGKPVREELEEDEECAPHRAKRRATDGKLTTQVSAPVTAQSLPADGTKKYKIWFCR